MRVKVCAFSFISGLCFTGNRSNYGFACIHRYVFCLVGARFHVILPFEQVQVIDMLGLHVRW